MRLDQALVVRGLCESREEAQECILAGHVTVDDSVVTKKTKQINDRNTIVVTQRRKFVSRGGNKLEGELLNIFETETNIKSNLNARCALDVGSSTGGFTDCLLSYGVSSVACVDVGTNQLHERLRKDARVSLFESTDIRDFNNQHTYDLIVGDVSFITLEKIIEKLINLGSVKTEYFLLLKPQFEVGHGNTKKGIVKNDLLIESILLKYEVIFSEHFNTVKVHSSCIKGADGNQEFFIYCKDKKNR